MIINILSLILSLLLIYSTFLSFKKNYFNIFEMIGWLLIWFGIIYLSIRPDAIDVYIQNSLTNMAFQSELLAYYFVQLVKKKNWPFLIFHSK